MHQKTTSIPQWWRMPAVCVLCRQYHRGVLAICQPCMDLLQPIRHSCNICRLPLIDEKRLLCAQCLNKKPSFNQVISHYLFEEPLRTLIHIFKYQETLGLAPFLLRLMLDAKPPIYQPDCLVPVPMHSKKLKQRGFNQAVELTKRIAKHLDISYDLNLCKKTDNTEKQVSLSLKKRKLNLLKAFVANSNTYKHVTIIDDLLTTGSTANALALCLKETGVERVDVWCIARTGLSFKDPH